MLHGTRELRGRETQRVAPASGGSAAVRARGADSYGPAGADAGTAGEVNVDVVRPAGAALLMMPPQTWSMTPEDVAPTLHLGRRWMDVSGRAGIHLAPDPQHLPVCVPRDGTNCPATCARSRAARRGGILRRRNGPSSRCGPARARQGQSSARMLRKALRISAAVAKRSALAGAHALIRNSARLTLMSGRIFLGSITGSSTIGLAFG